MPERSPSYVPWLLASPIRHWARITPTKVAIRDGARELTFAGLVERIDRLGNAVLEGLGLEPGQRAAILAPNTLEYVELLVGLPTAGIVAVPITAGAAPEEIRRLCDASAAAVVFVHPSYEEAARASDAASVERFVVLGEEYEQLLAGARATTPARQPDELDPCRILFTSGSTGEAKGVTVAHRGRMLFYLAAAGVYGCYSPTDNHLAIAPLSHGIGSDRALASVMMGGTCTIASLFYPERILRTIESRGITNTILVPTHLRALIDAPTGSDISSLRTVVVGGAPISLDTKQRFVERFGDGMLFEDYGSSEVPVLSVLRPEDQLRKPGSVGRPWFATELRIVDEDRADVQDGESGQVLVRSPFAFDGYWERPDLTAVALRDAWYSTGDQARRDDEGYYYVLDRLDDRITSGGYHLSAYEIESVIVEHPQIAEVAVFGVPDARLGEALRAAVVLVPGSDAGVEELAAFCADRLAGYKRPQVIDVVQSLPRGPLGKIQRRDLRAPFLEGGDRAYG